MNKNMVFKTNYKLKWNWKRNILCIKKDYEITSLNTGNFS